MMEDQKLIYPDSLSLHEALQVYFSHYHFAGGGYNLKWFRIKLGPLFIPLPNIKSRVEAVKIHDLHHVITGYNADYRGEAEIGAWEIAGGCGKYLVAWILNLGSFMIGMLFYQRALLRAFLRGRNSTTNLYYNTTYDETLLQKSVGELRHCVEPHPNALNNRNDYVMFLFWCFLALAYHALLAAAFVIALVYLINLFH